MKTVVLTFLLALAFVAGSFAQAGRTTAPAPTGKLNKRPPQASPTPSPSPQALDAVNETPNLPADTSATDGDVIKVDTQLVTIPVRILDKKGRFVGGLAKENFKVSEDGMDQDIAYFSNEQQPFTVALVLDMSYSTTFKIAEIQSAAIAFIDQLGAHDKIMVMSFDEEVHVLCEATNDRQKIYQAIRGTSIQTGTSLYEAMDLLINDRLKKIQGRKAVILFTDGVDTTSTHADDRKNLDDVMELDALIYPIRYDTFADVQAMKDKPVYKPSSPIPTSHPNGSPFPFPLPSVGTPSGKGTTAEDYQRAAEYLDQLSIRTGGQLYEASTTINLTAAFSRIASELREYYSLGFYPNDAIKVGKVRKLKVKVDKEGVVVRARDSYVVGGKKRLKRT